jgi:hypothetical protein
MMLSLSRIRVGLAPDQAECVEGLPGAIRALGRRPESKLKGPAIARGGET